LKERVSLTRGDLLSGYQPKSNIDLIVANPPYVSEEEFDSLQPSVRDFEPKLALVADPLDPLRCHKLLLKQALGMLKKKGKLIMEFGCQHSDLVSCMSADGFEEPKFFKDLAGHTRGAIFQKY